MWIDIIESKVEYANLFKSLNYEKNIAKAEKYIIKGFDTVRVQTAYEYVHIDNPLRCSADLAVKFEDQGNFNGDVLCVVDYDNDDHGFLDILGMKIKFFDSRAGIEHKKIFPQRISVNGILETTDNYIALIRRENISGIACPDYWDFPAGLVPFSTSPDDRLVDRVEVDTKLKHHQFTPSKNPSFVEYRNIPGDNSFNFYYPVQCHMNAEQLWRHFIDNLDREFAMMKRGDIPEFLKQQKKIYPILPLQEIANLE